MCFSARIQREGDGIYPHPNGPVARLVDEWRRFWRGLGKMARFRHNPFGLSLSKPSTSLKKNRKGKGFDKLSPNG
jgi:hypothetical protein